MAILLMLVIQLMSNLTPYLIQSIPARQCSHNSGDLVALSGPWRAANDDISHFHWLSTGFYIHLVTRVEFYLRFYRMWHYWWKQIPSHLWKSILLPFTTKIVNVHRITGLCEIGMDSFKKIIMLAEWRAVSITAFCVSSDNEAEKNTFIRGIQNSVGLKMEIHESIVYYGVCISICEITVFWRNNVDVRYCECIDWILIE